MRYMPKGIKVWVRTNRSKNLIAKMATINAVTNPISRFKVSLPENEEVIVDDDAGAPKRAADFMATFDMHVKEARALTMRKLFAPMGWGFGRGGYSWGGSNG